MRWSQLRARVESEFAEDIRDRISIHFTRHHEISRCGRGWITVDGVEIANFCDWSVYYPNPEHRPSCKDNLAAYGELRAWDFKAACWSLLHDGIDPALASDDPLLVSLAVLHRKFGRRRLAKLLEQREQLHPLVRYLAELREHCSSAPGWNRNAHSQGVQAKRQAPSSMCLISASHRGAWRLRLLRLRKPKDFEGGVS